MIDKVSYIIIVKKIVKNKSIISGASMERIEVKIHGIVQGVGFRPFIHKLVREYNLAGYIKNTSSGVEMELEGEEEELKKFISDVPEKAPKLALIEKIECEYGLPIKGFDDFEIKSSKREDERNTLISPDICICDDCLKEMLDPSDRRYGYPFINCTNCGPRFTIIKDVPYDRAKTSMSDFSMCEDCDREYHDIENRRYHAQPDACQTCGPHVYTVPESGNPIETARIWLKEGKIVCVKGLGGMHLACDISLAGELRKRKQRDEKPFAVMCRNTGIVRQYCELSKAEEKILTDYHRPIVLLKKKTELKGVTNNGYLGVMLPYTPLHYLLFGDDIDILIMTSANLSDTPIMYKNDEALEKLEGIADGFLLHNRDIQTRCDDSLCWVNEGHEYFARRSRGYVPFPIKVPVDKELLGCGAEQKASFALSKDNYVFLSQHIGDLKNMETYEHYEKQIEHFKRLFDITPTAAACDLHPDYLSTAYAKALDIPVYEIQHHHAHMASCMADNNLDGKVTGLIWDGTGLGTDGTIWGAECLSGGYEGFERISHIREIPLIGGDAVTRDLDRIAYALLEKSGNEVYDKMLASNLNCPGASSMGRLFDGAAAICGILHKASYEGQGAVLLEAAAKENVEDSYTVEFDGSGIFDWRTMINELSEDKNPARFMNTLIKMAAAQCEMAGNEKVVLSGGTFQNQYLLRKLPEVLKKKGFDVYTHKRVSCNDEGIGLGQICVLRYLLK